MKLSRLDQKFEKADIKDEKMSADFKFIDQFVEEIFPTTEKVDDLMKSFLKNDKNLSFFLHARSLSFHTRDDEWLALYLEKAIAQINLNQDNKSCLTLNLSQSHKRFDVFNQVLSIDYNTFLMYVKMSKKFDKYRTMYEHCLVKDYVTRWIQGDAYDFYYTDKEKKNFKKKINYEEVFRKSVIDAMQALGLKIKSIEEGLELCADIWLIPTICQGLKNEKNILKNKEWQMLCKYKPEVAQTLQRVEFERLATSARLHEYYYYQNHHEVIDRLGTATKNMKMTREEVLALEKNNVNNHRHQASIILNQIAFGNLGDNLNQDINKKIG